MRNELLEQRDKPKPVAVTQLEAAKLLGKSCRTLHRWDKAGKLKPTRVGGSLMYPLKRLEEFAQHGKHADLEEGGGDGDAR